MKASKAIVQKRVEEVLAIRLDGAEFWDVREFVREQEQEEGSAWHLTEGQKPLSDSQIWRYLAKADKMVAESCRASRKKLLRRHLAQRRNLYAKAVSQGDVKAALAAARDEAELLGLYPARKTELTGKNGAPVVLSITEEVVGRAPQPLANIVEEVVNNAADGNAAEDNPPSPGAADVHQE
jgi:hypothetical protein